MYNVAIFEYAESVQIRVYDVPISEECFTRKVLIQDVESGLVRSSDERALLKFMARVHSVFNPFSGRVELMEQLPDDGDRDYLKESLNRTVNTIYSKVRSMSWDWFVTFTFNPDKVDSFNYTVCSKKLSDWLKNMRKVCPDMVYLIVPERHKSGRYHYHGLFAGISDLSMVDSGHKTSDNLTIYNLSAYKWGFTTATRVQDSERCCGYLIKYITKDLISDIIGKKRYWASRNIPDPLVTRLSLSGDNLQAFLAGLPNGAYVTSCTGEYQRVTYYDIRKDLMGGG